MPFNITSIKTSSNGAWQGDNPLDFAFPLLIVQTTLILVLSRFLAFLLKPLRQPKVIAEIVGGILLGPSAFGRNEDYLHRIFPSWSMPVLETVASIGLIFFLFLVGLELDLSSIRRSGRRAFGIAFAGISLPFVLNDETFAILVLMALFTTFVTTPTVMAIYKPARGSSALARRKLRDLANTDESKDELRVLACLHGLSNVPSIISLIESTRSTKKSQLKLFVMHLVELTERSSSIIMVQRAGRNGLPFIKRLRRGEWQDRVAGAFQAYSQLGRVKVRPTTAISALSSMHEDICHVAETKQVTMIVLPFHKQWRLEGEQRTVENVGHGWRLVNQRVLKNAPCSVAVLVDRGFGNGGQTPGPTTTESQRVCILFFGGPDDREALELGGRMAEHPAVKVVVVRFVENEGLERDGESDEAAVAEFRSKWDGMVEYTEKTSRNFVEEVLGLGQCGDYDLIVVGKGRFPSPMVAKLADRQAEHAELGPIGDLLSSSGRRVLSSVLVIQQHDMAHAEETPVSKFVQHDYDKLKSDGSSGMGEISKVV
ncbi:Cation/H+ exchanger - like 10 [Theobroma cacao]|nr:Cation/H+ exchanger - like 10 [Theobroma cacao]